MTEQEEQKIVRGFGLLEPHQRSRLGKLGAKAAHERGLSHKFSPAEASAAGRKGAESRAAKKQARLANLEKTD